MSAAGIPVRRAPKHRAAAAALALALGLALPANPLAASPSATRSALAEQASEYEVKAHFLTHFVKYTTWPKSAFESDEAPFVVLVVGEDPFGEYLEKAFSGKKGAGRPIRIVRSEDVADLPRAHLIFLARSHAGEIGRLLDAHAGSSALVVCDSEGLAERGAHINLFLEGRNLRFEVNTDALKRNDLSINAEMLKLARIVKDRAQDRAP